MFGRVSTIDLGMYSNIPDVTDYVLGRGVIAGKKWTGTLAPDNDFGDYTIPQVESGWIELQDGDVYYPEYTHSGPNLPDFVSMYREEDGSPSDQSYRVLVGEGTPSIGPFTLPEAVYFYSVVKKIKSEINFDAFTATAGGSTATITSVFENEYVQNYAGTNTSFSEPYYLFRVARKNFNSLYGEGYNSTIPSTTSESAYVQIVANARQYRNPTDSLMENTAFIAVDIDNPDEYYIHGLGFDLYIVCEANSSATTPPSAPEYGYSSASIFKGYSLKPHRWIFAEYTFDEQGQPQLVFELTDVGQTVQYGAATYTYVSIPHTYTIGEITKTHNFYGIVTDYTSSYSDGESPPQPPAVSVQAPNPVFAIDATEFWPYKTANGQPVYDTSTGSITNSPLP